MPKKPETPAEDPNLAAFRAILAKKKAAQATKAGPVNMAGKAAKDQKPRPKERMRRRP